MSASEILKVGQMAANPNNPEAIVNEIEQQIEGRIVRVLSRTNGGPPASPAAGDTYIVDVASGSWASAAVDDLAHYYSGAWVFVAPAKGWRLRVIDESLVAVVFVSVVDGWCLDTAAPQLSVDCSGGVDVTLTEEESRHQAVKATGALTANINLVVTNTPKFLMVENATTGAYTLTVKTATGTGVMITQTKRQLLYCDGINVVPVAAEI